jgi:arylsulfatase A-like enzyme
MPMVRKGFHPAVGKKAGPGTQQRAGGLFLTTLWFGLLAGWLELGLVLAQRAINPHIPLDALRTNRHFVWMVPVSDVLIFGIVGLAIALLAKLRPGLAWWTAWRLPVGLSFLTLLLTIDGLFAIACVVLAGGLASTIGPWLGRRAADLGRVVRLSFPVMAVGLVVLTGLTYKRVTSAEHRALALHPPARPGAPNVLLIVLDTVRAASLGLYGYDRATTPNLERLARKGVVFAEARSSAPWTLPSIASMMTGCWPHELSVAPDLPLDGTFPTLAEVLGREGYATAGFVGNTWYCSSRLGLGRGFARYQGAYENQTVSLFEIVRSSGLGRRITQVLGYPIHYTEGETSVRKTAAMINRDVLGWLAGRPAGEPYFVFINYYDAHAPYLVPDGDFPHFGMAALPIVEQAEIDRRFLEQTAEMTAMGSVASGKIVTDAMTLYRDRYESSIAYLDQQVGLLLDVLDCRGSLENTLVIVTSDHGEHLGEHGLLGHAQSLYRREVHVPLVVIPPSRSSTSRTVYEPVSLRDIPATVAQWADLGPGNPFPGHSLTRFLNDGTERLADISPVLSEVQHIEAQPRAAHIPSSLGPVRSLVSGNRVYIRSGGGREELYDLWGDPLESDDLTKYPRARPVIGRFREELGRLCRGVTIPAR